MSVRLVRAEDAPVLQDLERRAGARFRDVGMPEIADDDPMPQEQLVAYADAGRSWVAEDAGVVVGYIVVDEVDGNAHVEQVTVDPDHQGRGIGRLLLDAAEAWAAERGMLALTTFRDVQWNAPLYRHLGFRDLGEDELGTELRRLRDDEAAHGLDPSLRICMRRVR